MLGRPGGMVGPKQMSPVDNWNKLQRDASVMRHRVSQVEKRHVRRRKFVIDPRSARWMGLWDLATATALVFTALATPFEVSYLPPSTSGVLFIVNRLVDAIFIADLVLNFFLVYPSSASESGAARWVDDHVEIARHYLRGWFTIDLLSCVTIIFDLPIWEFQASSNVDKLKVVRLLRVLRLIKLLRLLRGMRILKRWETRLEINYGMLSLVQSMLFVVLFAHWSSCCWVCCWVSIYTDAQTSGFSLLQLSPAYSLC